MKATAITAALQKDKRDSFLKATEHYGSNGFLIDCSGNDFFYFSTKQASLNGCSKTLE